MRKVIVGMSGGVDSAVAAYLMKAAGFHVTGVTLRILAGEDGTDSRCCEIGDASDTARRLGIDYYVRNAVSLFQKNVVEPFSDEYLHGRTPNPCVECNRHVKWELLMEAASVMRTDYVATGHYASVVRLENERYTIRRAASRKDQSYMLYRLTQEQLARTVMPLANLSKDEVRHIAKRIGLPIAEKRDSQEICFVADGSYREYIEAKSQPPGNFVDENGSVVGRHDGIFRYTVGQRKGLGLALGYPAYVKAINADTNEIVIGSETSLYNSRVICGSLTFMSISGMNPGERLRAKVKVRYHHEGEDATIEKYPGDAALVDFDHPVRAATPGQSAVFYDESGHIVGGGKIIRAT